MISRIDPDALFQMLDVDQSGYIEPVEFSNSIQIMLDNMDAGKISGVNHKNQPESCRPYQPDNNVYGKHEVKPWYNSESNWDPNNLWVKYSNQDYFGLKGAWKMSKAEFKQMMEDYGRPAVQQPEKPQA